MQQRAGFMAGRERRQLNRKLSAVAIDKRAEDGSGGMIRGIAAVYYRENDPTTEYWLWNDMVERIHKGAFDRAIKEQHDARGLFNHDSSQLLGRVSSGTTRLSLVDTGLAYEIDADPNDPDHQRVMAKIDRGDVTGSSFAFLVRKVVWEEQRLDDGSWIYIRNIHDVDLFDVGPVTFPAYEGTSAGRSAESANLQIVMNDLPFEIRELIAEREQQLRARDDQDIAMRLRLLEVD